MEGKYAGGAPGIAGQTKKHGARQMISGHYGRRDGRGKAAQVLHYLGRYTHRVPLSTERLLDVKDGQVTFQWKDYRSKNKQKSCAMTLGEARSSSGAF